MITARARSAAPAAVCAAVLVAGCGAAEPDSDGADSEVSEEATVQAAPAEIEGVQNFYGEYGDYPSAMEAIGEGDVTAEDLEHPWVARRGHVDAEGDWDGTLPVYDMAPPAGGDHLSVWQTCTGAVYGGPIVEGNAVHSMEHGAVWLTYDPELVDEDQVTALAERIEGRDYSLMSPYPGQGVPVSLQSWGNQYRTEDPADPNIDAYLDAYILNEAYTPEPNATCSGGNTALAQ